MFYEIKRIFLSQLFLLIILLFIGLSAVFLQTTKAVECPTLSAGDLFKVPDNSAVYLLNADKQRMYFPHSTVFKTWYEDFSSVIEIPNTCVDNYPAPSAPPYGVNYRPGSKLVKVQISPSVYVVEPGNKKSKLGSEAVASALYGADWASKVVDIADVFWPNYTATGDEISQTKPHDGMLVREEGGVVYEIKNNLRYLVDGNPRDSADVQTVTQAVLNSVAEAAGSVTASDVYKDPAQTAAPETAPTEEQPQIILDAKEVVAEVKNIRITNATGESANPSVVWTGENFGLVWEDKRGGKESEIFFALLDKSGKKLVEDVQITNTPDLMSVNPKIVWSGSEFGVVYTEYSAGVAMSDKLNFTRINLTGAKVGGIVEVATDVDQANPSIASDGSGYSVVWRAPRNTNAKTYFSYVNANSTVGKNQVKILDVEGSDDTDIVWDGEKFGVIYRQSDKFLPYGTSKDYTVGTYLYRIDKDANSEKPIQFITGKEALAAVWDGAKYAVAEVDRTYSVFSIGGNLTVLNAKVSDSALNRPDIANSVNGYGIVGERSGLVRFVEVGKNGSILQTETSINDVVNSLTNNAKIVFASGVYNIVWADDKDGNSGREIYFRAIK